MQEQRSRRIIVNGLDKETVGGLLVPFLMEWNCANPKAEHAIIVKE